MVGVNFLMDKGDWGRGRETGEGVTCEIFTVIRSSSSSRDWLVATVESCVWS